MGNTDLQDEDAVWTTGLLKNLPSVPVPAELQQHILASFDAVSARRHDGFGGAMRRFAGTVWPGVPAWRPAAVLAFSLVIGVIAGTAIPLEGAMADNSEQSVSIALDAPPAFDLDENS
jgi:hypothetical protein